MQKEPVKQQAKEPRKKWINPLRDRTRVIPFVVPDKEERMNALGSLAGEKWRLKKSLQAILDDFDPIKAPEPGDNLWEYEEEGQGFGLFASRSRNHIDMSTEYIYIATFHCSLSKDALKRIRKCAKAFFWGVKIKLHEFSKCDLSKFAPVQSINGQQYYDAALLNLHFARCLPAKAYSVAILTDLLIYNGDNPNEAIEERWVFGLGSIKDRTSLISVQQIVKKGYGCKQQEGEETESEHNLVFVEKVVNHELCHTFAMRHCIYYRCLMNGTNQYKEAVQKDEHLCPICLRKLQLALQFDVAERYDALGDPKSQILAAKIRASFPNSQ